MRALGDEKKLAAFRQLLVDVKRGNLQVAAFAEIVLSDAYFGSTGDGGAAGVEETVEERLAAVEAAAAEAQARGIYDERVHARIQDAGRGIRATRGERAAGGNRARAHGSCSST